MIEKQQPAIANDPLVIFCDLWWNGSRPDVVEFVEYHGLRQHPIALAAILRNDLKFRWQAGEAVLSEWYLEWFPELLQEPESAVDLLFGEYLQRIRSGEAVEHEMFSARFPGMATEMQRQIAFHESLEHQLPADGPNDLTQAFFDGDTEKRGDVAGGISFQRSAVERPHPANAKPPSISPYRIEAEIGRGGMAVVYRATDESLGRTVAIKFLTNAALSSGEQLQRFQVEAKAAARIQHPNVVQIFQVGQQDGQPYLVLEFVDGGTLAEFSGQPQPPQAAAELMKKLANALQYAHEQGVVHRDLKPANVLLRRSSMEVSPSSSSGNVQFQNQLRSGTEPVVTDFGLAKLMTQETSQQRFMELTRTGELLGTPSYMAPEQIDPAVGEIGPATDIHALGAILYGLLTGRPPFLSASPIATLRQVVADVPAAPTGLTAGIPRDLQTICLKCLEKDRARRYDSAMGLANDLERFLAGEPVLACPPSARYRLGKVIRRNKTLVASGAMILLLLVGGVIAQSFALVEVSRERTAKEIALKAESKRRTQTRAALDAMSSSVIEGWLTKQPVLQPEHIDFLRLAVSFYEEFAADTGEDEESRRGTAAALYRVARIREQLGEYTEAKKILQRCCDHYQALLRDFPSNRSDRSAYAAAFHELQQCRLNSGEYADSEGGVRQAVKTNRELVAAAPDDRKELANLAVSLSTLGMLMRQLGRLAEGESALNESITILEGVVPQVPDDEQYQSLLGESLTNLANVLGDMDGREEDAINAGRRTVEIHESLLTKSPRSLEFRAGLSLVNGNLSHYLIALKRYAEAEVAARKSIEILVQLVLEFPAVPQYRRSLAIARNNLGIALKDSGQLPEAEEEYRQALAIHEELSASHPESAEHQNAVGGASVNVARVLLMRNDPQGARELLEKATPFHQAALTASPNHPQFRYFYRINRWRLAEALLALKEHTAAADMSAQFLQMASERPRDAITATCLFASCVNLATEDPSLPAAEQQGCADKYAQSALETLHQAILEGFTDVEFLKSDSQLEPLRNREEFQAIVRKLDSP